jgi:ABC-2 type transport system permease protein
MMGRIFTIAQTELLALVRTKAFIIGIFLMPILMVGFISFMNYAEEHIDTADRRFAVLDRTGALYEPIAAAARDHNDESGHGDERTGPHFLPVAVDGAGRSRDDLVVELSRQVRDGELFAFVEIPAAILDPPPPRRAAAAPTGSRDQADEDAGPVIRYYAENPSYDALSDWLDEAIDREIARVRFQRTGVDPALVEPLTTGADVSAFGLVERGVDGTAAAAREVDDVERIGLPMFVLVLMFLCVMTGAMHLLNAVIEEKMSKISEVLLGSVTPFQLLMGKLLGVVGVSLLLTLVYLVGGIYTLLSFGRPDLIDPGVIGWFLVFLVCAALMFGAIFLAVGSACSDLKDSQSMVQPAMMLILLAYLGSFVVMRAPDSGLAVGLSMFPTMTPFAMMLRIVMPPGPPLWQVLLSVAVLVASTAAIVWAGGRIFRVGLLMQGKPPNLPELLRWIGR